jgi:transposase
MNPLAQLGQLNLDPAAKSQVVALFHTLLDQAAHDAKTIQAKVLKIQALTHELAHIRRIRYGVKSEALSPLQRDVFEEGFNADLAAIEQFKDEETGGTGAKPKRPRAGRQPLPGHLPHRTPARI